MRRVIAETTSATAVGVVIEWITHPDRGLATLAALTSRACEMVRPIVLPR